MSKISEESQKLLDAFDDAAQDLAFANACATQAEFKQAQQEWEAAKEALTQHIQELEQAAAWANYD